MPIALNEACDGAVQGALLGIGATAVCGVGAAGVLRALGRVETMHDAIARVRLPSVVLAVVTLLQMGLTTCGARLFVDGDHGLGVVGMLCGALLLPLNPLIAYTVASRQCYALTPTPQVPGGGKGQVVVRWFMSSTELDIEVYPPVYTQIVGRWMRPSAIWTCLVPITPVLMLVWRSVEVCDGAVVGLPMGVNVGSGGGDGVGVLLVIVWVVVGGAISDGVGV